MKYDFVLVDENDEPFFETSNEQELRFALQQLEDGYFPEIKDARAEVWYFHDTENNPYTKKIFIGAKTMYTANLQNGVIGRIIEKTNDMGLAWDKVGQFNDRDELSQLFDEYYPWSIDEIEKRELLEELLSNGYLVVEDSDIGLMQIVDENKLYLKYEDISVMEFLGDLLYDDTTKNYLLTFSNSGWFRRDGAIDLATGTVGYYNAQDSIYTPVGSLHEQDIRLLENIVTEQLTVDYEFSVKRANSK